MPKVLIIGLDGATWNIIKPLVDEGKLPTFKKLMANGVWGKLESTIPPITIPAWNAISTGKNPGKLGIFSFMSRNEGRYDFKPYFFNRKQRDNNFWDILSDEGKRVILFNIPNIHYPYRINGYMIAGWLYSPTKTLTYPSTLKKTIDNISGGYEIDVLDVNVYNEGMMKRRMTDKKYIEAIDRIMDKRFKVLNFLIKEQWDCLFAVFSGTDRMQHKFYQNRRIMLHHYKKIDNFLNMLLQTIKDDVVLFIVSDHGFGPLKKTFNINEWLVKEGYLTLKVAPVTPFRLLSNFIRKIRLTSLKNAIFNRLPSRFSERVLKKSKPFGIENARINWKQTKVFAYAHVGDLYVNLVGRDIEGAVNPSDYERLRDEIIQKLSNLIDGKTGEKIPAKVWRREDVYKGEYVDKAPDLIVEIDDNIQSIGTKMGFGEIFMDSSGGQHRKDGIFIAYGRGIKKGMQIENLDVYNIAPTILHIFNLPIPEDMDGRVLMNVFFEKSEFAKRKTKYVKPLDKEKRRVIERIKKLKRFKRI